MTNYPMIIGTTNRSIGLSTSSSPNSKTQNLQQMANQILSKSRNGASGNWWNGSLACSTGGNGANKKRGPHGPQSKIHHAQSQVPDLPIHNPQSCNPQSQIPNPAIHRPQAVMRNPQPAIHKPQSPMVTHGGAWDPMGQMGDTWGTHPGAFTTSRKRSTTGQ